MPFTKCVQNSKKNMSNPNQKFERQTVVLVKH